MRIGRPQGPGRLQGGPGPALSPSVLCLNRLFSPRSLLSLVQGFSPWSPLPAVLLFPGVSLSCCISEIPLLPPADPRPFFRADRASVNGAA